MRDPWERIVAASRAGIYESNYLKANSPDGTRALWLKHNLMRPLDGPAYAELWAILSERDGGIAVAKREVPWGRVSLDPGAVRIDAGAVRLTAHAASGALADLSWDLRLSRPAAPLYHFRADRRYRAAFPAKKLLTPAPNLHFDGVVQVGGTRWEVRDWVGLRGHNWSTAHPTAYAYGNCNLWDDGDPTRVVDGFSGSITVAGARTPWLSALVGYNPHLRRDRLRDLPARATVQPDRWTVAWDRPHVHPVRLEMWTDPARYAGLRYRQPGGGETCCYNTKFADVRLEAGGAVYTSRCGELEILQTRPLPSVPLHPTGDWDPGAGDYRSAP